MPTWMPEGDISKPGDDAQRSLQKLVSASTTGGAYAGGGNYSGNGSPEGVVTASPGATYVNLTDGGLWAKTSGFGSTGWTQKA